MNARNVPITITPARGDALVGYFRTVHHQSKYSAALLVTDPFGVPVEFKYIQPLVPDSLQRQIYGKMLEEYLRSRLMNSKLLASLESTPLFFVTAWDEWTTSEKFGSFDLLALRPESSSEAKVLGKASVGLLERFSPTEVSLYSNQLQLVRIRFFIEDAHKQGAILEQLKKLDTSMDIVEPLERLDHALHHICRQSTS